MSVSRLGNQLQIFDALTDRHLHEVPEDQTAEWPLVLLSVFGQDMKADVVSHERPAQVTGAFEQQIIRQPIGVILLRRQNIDLSKSQLPHNGMIDVNVEIQRDGHVAPPLK